MFVCYINIGFGNWINFVGIDSIWFCLVEIVSLWCCIVGIDILVVSYLEYGIGFKI